MLLEEGLAIGRVFHVEKRRALPHIVLSVSPRRVDVVAPERGMKQEDDRSYNGSRIGLKEIKDEKVARCLFLL